VLASPVFKYDVETYPDDPSPVVVDTRKGAIELKYPADPRPIVVDTKKGAIELRYPDDPSPTIVD